VRSHGAAHRLVGFKDFAAYIAFYAVFLKLILIGLAALIRVSGIDDLECDPIRQDR
jgi:hypothetical protein